MHDGWYPLLRNYPHHCVPTRYCQVQNAGKLLISSSWTKILIVFFYLGFPRYVLRSRWWFRQDQGRWGIQGIHSRKYSYTILTYVAFRDGLQPSSDTPLKVSESSDSMRSSRMSTELPPVTTLPSTKLLDSLSPPHVLRSSLIASFAHSKP